MTEEQWKKDNGPLHCPRCGSSAVKVELLDSTTRLRELLSCECGEAAEFLNPPVDAFLPMVGMGLSMARNLFLSRWKHRPSGVRRWPWLAQRVSRPPQNSIESWSWEGATWSLPGEPLDASTQPHPEAPL